MAVMESPSRVLSENQTRTSFLIFDTESVPDARLLNLVKYPAESLGEEEAIERARSDARDTSWNGSDFIPVTFQYPVAICVARVAADLSLQKLTCLDSPHFRPRELVKQFWMGVGIYKEAKLVTFNGRGFDLPLLELGAFRYGISGQRYFHTGRDRYRGGHLDLLEWFTNFGAYKLQGGLNLLAKLLGKPGKMDVAGDQVLEMYRAGKLQEINDYCLCDTLDTYFIFLRTRVLMGEITPEVEADRVAQAREYLQGKVREFPVLGRYLEHWVDPPETP